MSYRIKKYFLLVKKAKLSKILNDSSNSKSFNEIANCKNASLKNVILILKLNPLKDVLI